MAYSIFDKDYKVAINNILKDVYRDTDYWGRSSSGNEGIVKPLTPEDDPKWSNYNFINTHWTVRDKIIVPFLGNMPLEMDKEYKDSEANTRFFKALWTRRHEIFGPDSTLKYRIVDAINKTRNSGSKRESFVKTTLESIDGIKVNMVSEAGGTQDFMGIDLTIESTVIPSGTAQVKPFKSITTDKDYWYVTTDLRRKYNTDYMIFGKQNGMEYHVAVFFNKPDQFIFTPDGRLAIPKNLIKLLINYNVVSRKSSIKAY